MEIIFSAFLGEIANRSISFFVDKLSKQAASRPSDENLHHKLLRVRIIVEEAEGRQIRNQAMLEQLKVLRAGMYRGYYVLDTFKCGAYREDDHGAVSHSFALSAFNPAKRVQLCGGSSHGGEKELRQVIGSLEIMITDASEFVMFLNGCPPLLYRQPYTTYLVMEQCMFGRHVEMEYIVNFLMQKGSPGAEDLDVLPIIGTAESGKTTLIEHACNDERVRTAFSRIVLFTEDDLDERITCVRDGGTIKHQSHTSDRDESVLVIVEVNGDINEATWSSLYLSSKRCKTNGGKIIVCSRCDKIIRFGTTQALKVEYLTQEAYWYFFKALAFGGVDLQEELKLASIAMEIAAGLSGSFIAANVTARILRANFSAKFWHMALSCIKEVNQRYRFIFGAHPVSPSQNRKQLRRLSGSNEAQLITFFNDYQTVSAQNEAPLITFQEVWLGSVVPHGKFDVLAWRSSIPPYYSYTLSCEIHEAAELGVRKKHVILNSSR